MGIFDDVLPKPLPPITETNFSKEGFTDKFSYILGLQRNKADKIIKNVSGDIPKYKIKLLDIRKKLATLEDAPLITNLKVLKPWHAVFEGRAKPKEVQMYFDYRTKLYVNKIYDRLLTLSEDTMGNFRHVARLGIIKWYKELVTEIEHHITLHPIDKKIMQVAEEKTTWYLLPHSVLGIIYQGTLPATWSVDQLGLYPCGIVGDEMNITRITSQIKDGFWNKFFLVGLDFLAAPFNGSANFVLSAFMPFVHKGAVTSSLKESFKEASYQRLVQMAGQGSAQAAAAVKAGRTIVKTVDVVTDIMVAVDLIRLLLIRTCRCINVTRRKYDEKKYSNFKQYENLDTLMADIEVVIDMCTQFPVWIEKMKEEYMRVQTRIDKIDSDLQEQNYMSVMATFNLEFETLVNSYVSFIKEYTEMVESAI